MKILNLEARLKRQNSAKIVNQTIKVLKKGGLVVYPTETCYGIAADATNKKAVKKLLEYKGKRAGKAISIAVADKQMAAQYVDINPTAANLYQNFLPGPLTIVSQSKGKVIPQLENSTKTLGIRIPDYPFILKIIKKLNKPITATSANTSGKKPPYSLQDLEKYTSKKKLAMIDLFLDAGKLSHRLPSSVVDTTLNELKLLRQGKITIPKIKNQSFVSNSEAETKKISRQILNKYKKVLKNKTLVFALQGELGAGKTQFVKGLAQAVKITINVPSPTFILMREYSFPCLLQAKQKQTQPKTNMLYHIDAWRMEKEEELLELGLEKMIKPGNIIAIEWLEKIKPLLEKIEKEQNKKIKVVWLTIDYLNQTKRKIKYN